MEIEARCRKMLDHCAAARIDPVASEALWQLDRAKMEAVAEEATKVGYRSPDVLEIRQKLALSEQEFVKLQLKRANELNDPERIINREIRLREIYLQKFGDLFALKNCPLLHDPVEWACLKSFGLARNKDSLATSFLVHTMIPIHAPLTKIQGPLAKGKLGQAMLCIGSYIAVVIDSLLCNGYCYSRGGASVQEHYGVHG